MLDNILMVMQKNKIFTVKVLNSSGACDSIQVMMSWLFKSKCLL